MDKNHNIAIFENRKIRKIWDDKEEKWYFSVVDIVAALSQSDRPRKYWDDLRRRLKKEGSELSEKIGQLKLASSDGKYYLTDVANTETIFRLIQSIPSPNAEPFKLWLARIGYERIEEIQDPEKAIVRAKNIYEKKGYSDDWIAKRMRGINVRNTLTDEWKNRGAEKGIDFAILTNEIYKGTFDMAAKEIKSFKDLGHTDNPRDHMNELELILTMLGEATTTELTQIRNSEGLPKLTQDAKEGGEVAGNTRKQIEQKTRKNIVTKQNFLNNNQKKLNSKK